jgi:hypothetical protein
MIRPVRIMKDAWSLPDLQDFWRLDPGRGGIEELLAMG